MAEIPVDAKTITKKASPGSRPSVPVRPSEDRRYTDVGAHQTRDEVAYQAAMLVRRPRTNGRGSNRTTYKLTK